MRVTSFIQFYFITVFNQLQFYSCLNMVSLLHCSFSCKEPLRGHADMFEVLECKLKSCAHKKLSLFLDENLTI